MPLEKKSGSMAEGYFLFIGDVLVMIFGILSAFCVFFLALIPSRTILRMKVCKILQSVKEITDQ